MALPFHQSRKRRLESTSSSGEHERKVGLPNLPFKRPRLISVDARLQKLRVFSEREDSLRSLATCKICFRVLYEPYTLACGHTYCYSCLCQWFDNALDKKKTCPDCRTVITKSPAPAYVLREMVRELLRRPELLPEGETVEQHHQNEVEEAAVVERDKLNKEPTLGGLFKGRFLHSNGRAPIQDFEDGVMRCPSCHWELEDDGDSCPHCHEVMHDQSDADFDDFGGPSDDEHELDGELEMDDAEFDETIAGNLGRYPVSPPGWETEAGYFDGEHTRHANGTDYDTSSSDTEGSLDDFVTGDEEDPNEASGSDSASSTATASPIPRSNGHRVRRRVIEDDEEDDADDDDSSITDNTAHTRALYNDARHRRRRVVSSDEGEGSSSESESEDSDVQVVASEIRHDPGRRSRLAGTAAAVAVAAAASVVIDDSDSDSSTD